MKKRVISVTAILAMLFGLMSMPQAQAQIFLDEEGVKNSQRSGTDDPGLPNVPQLGVTIDQYDDVDNSYAPLGGGILALGLLGGAYLLSKKRRINK